MCDIDAEFVRKWAQVYENRYAGTIDERDEKAISDWIERQPEPKCLDWEYFVRLGRWKTPRYNDTRKSNDEKTVIQVTRSAYQLQDDLTKLHTLKSLRGVGTAVASAILYFMEPNRYAIYDFHVRSALNKKKCWGYGKHDDSERVWLEYVDVMRGLAARLRVDLRSLEKALFAYDKHPDETESACR